MSIEDHHQSLGAVLVDLGEAQVKFDCLLAGIDEDIEMLSEFRGEVCERAEKVAQALDLNREAFSKNKGSDPCESSDSK